MLGLIPPSVSAWLQLLFQAGDGTERAIVPEWLQVFIALMGLAMTFLLWAAGKIINSLGRLNDKVAEQNGNVRELKTWKEGHEEHTDDQNKRISAIEERERQRIRDELNESWRSHDRRKHPRGGLTEE